MKYKNLAIPTVEELMFGKAPNPVITRRGLVFGAGKVYPEINFTLPPMKIEMGTLGKINEQYRDTVKEVIERGMQLKSQGIVFEFETLLEMTQSPEIGIQLVKTMDEVCEEYYQKHGFKSEIRLTPNDLREFERPPLQRTSSLLIPMMELFEGGAEAGAEMLSIESTGGKEISDDALMMCDIKTVLFALAVLGVRDMKMLWQKITSIANKTGRISAGDTACGFANTAMVLAEKGFIPKIFAALVRVISAVRTIVACEEGAVGPDKDCGYEGPYLKAIAGIPISMEGRTAACAHSSPIGNIAGACADLWSNESVQNVKLLGGMAPTVYYEQLEYDTRLYNHSILRGDNDSLVFQNLMVDSDVYLDPQALILSPENVIEISKSLIQGNSYVENAKNGALKALEIIERDYNSGKLELDGKELIWIDMLKNELISIPDNEETFISQTIDTLDKNKIILSEYGL
jgi:methanol--5-hydroxybenzimidazolylcobamide Co-methyltransferase